LLPASLEAARREEGNGPLSRQEYLLARYNH